MPPTIHGNMSGKSGISTDKMSLLSLFSGETRLWPDKGQILHPRHGLLPRKRLRGAYHSQDTCEVADNILVQSELKVLPVPICGQVKPSSACLSACYLPLLESGLHRICSAATSPSWTSAAPAPLLSATSFRLRPPPYMTTCAVAAAACGPGAKMSLAYATGPFSVPHGPAGPSRTTGGQILYGALQPPPQKSPRLIAEVRPRQV